MSFVSSEEHLKLTPRKESYFDIDDIMASQERVPCAYEVPALNLGYLDPSSDSDNIEIGTKMELPYWMAKKLATGGKRMVSIDLPQSYKKSQREILDADPSVVDLHKWGPYFYKFGMSLLNFEHPESPLIAKILLQTLQRRFRFIMDSSQNATHEDVVSVTKKLDKMELSIFNVGRKSVQELTDWESRQLEKLTTSKLVLNHRKRKRPQMENE